MNSMLMNFVFAFGVFISIAGALLCGNLFSVIFLASGIGCAIGWAKTISGEWDFDRGDYR